MKYGERVSWEYEHHLNKKSSTWKTKLGIFKGLIRHTIKHKGKQLAIVQFDGNKKHSRVPLEELELVAT